jgi:hypothetical protein
VLGFKVSDIYDGTKMPGGMVFLRCNGDPHCLALIGGLPGGRRGQGGGGGGGADVLHHIAFERATLERGVFRRPLTTLKK